MYILYVSQDGRIRQKSLTTENIHDGRAKQFIKSSVNTNCITTVTLEMLMLSSLPGPLRIVEALGRSHVEDTESFV